MIKSEAKGQAVLSGEREGDGVLLLTSKKNNGNDQQWKFSYPGFCSAGPLFAMKPPSRFEFPALLDWERTAEELGSSQPGCPLICTLTSCATPPSPAVWAGHPQLAQLPWEQQEPGYSTCKPALGLGSAIPDPSEKPNHPTQGGFGIKISLPPLSSHAFIAAQCTDKVGNISPVSRKMEVQRFFSV